MFKRASRAAEKWFALEGLLFEESAFLWRCGGFDFRLSSLVVSWLHVTNRRSGERYRKIKLFVPSPLHGAISDQLRHFTVRF
jgi:hypothetical protein